MLFDDFMRMVLAIFPDALVEECPDTGELVVYTGIQETPPEGRESIFLGFS